jgi:hypothetical protein
MLKRTSRSGPKPASETHDYESDLEIVARAALDLIKPKPEQNAEARKQVIDAIALIRSLDGAELRHAEKLEPREIASTLRGGDSGSRTSCAGITVTRI